MGPVFFEIGITEGILNSNPDNIIILVKLWESYYCYWMAYMRYELRSDVCVLSVMSTYFQCRPSPFCMMSILCILLMNGVTILLWVHMWSIFFSTKVSNLVQTWDIQTLDL